MLTLEDFRRRVGVRGDEGIGKASLENNSSETIAVPHLQHPRVYLYGDFGWWVRGVI